MRKITDRFWLGVMSGLGGNIAKMTVESVFNRIGFPRPMDDPQLPVFSLKKLI